MRCYIEPTHFESKTRIYYRHIFCLPHSANLTIKPREFKNFPWGRRKHIYRTITCSVVCYFTTSCFNLCTFIVWNSICINASIFICNCKCNQHYQYVHVYILHTSYVDHRKLCIKWNDSLKTNYTISKMSHSHISHEVETISISWIHYQLLIKGTV